MALLTPASGIWLPSRRLATPFASALIPPLNTTTGCVWRSVPLPSGSLNSVLSFVWQLFVLKNPYGLERGAGIPLGGFFEIPFYSASRQYLKVVIAMKGRKGYLTKRTLDCHVVGRLVTRRKDGVEITERNT